VAIFVGISKTCATELKYQKQAVDCHPSNYIFNEDKFLKNSLSGSTFPQYMPSASFRHDNVSR
jgi:hypothetical protein